MVCMFKILDVFFTKRDILALVLMFFKTVKLQSISRKRIDYVGKRFNIGYCSCLKNLRYR
jgi:hypothetical protein